MRILLVEDEDALAEELEVRIREALRHVERLDRAIGYADACVLIAQNTYDAALVDLRIPSAPRRDDASLEFGRAVEGEVARLQPGALRLFITAFSANEVADQLSSGEVDQLFVPGQRYRVVRYFQKERIQIGQCMDVLARHQAELDRLDGAPLEQAGALDPDCRRAVAIGLAFVGGRKARLVRPGGLSGSTTALLECLDDNDQPAGRCFVKIGPQDDIDAEVAGFEAVRFRWPTTALPHLACRITFGIGRSHALVFTHAPGTDNFFDLCRRDSHAAAEFIRSLRDIVGPQGASTVALSVGALRQEFVADDRIEPYSETLSGIGLDRVEVVVVELLEFLQHGDLHGANLLVKPNGEPFLIDFGRTGVHPGPLDPVLLELSLMFHPASGVQGVVSPDQCRQWCSGTYADGTVLAPVVRACRDLAGALGHEEAAIAAVAWAQSVRQLKYPDASKEHALAIAESCAERLSHLA